MLRTTNRHSTQNRSNAIRTHTHTYTTYTNILAYTCEHIHRPGFTFAATGQLSHRAAFTQRNLCTQRLLHPEAFTQRRLYKNFYKHTILHRETFHRVVFPHRSCNKQTHLHTKACTDRSFCSEKPFHSAAFAHRCSHTATGLPPAFQNSILILV